MSSSAAVVVVDGGDTGCGELLMHLAATVRRTAPGTTLRLIASDPAAPAELPEWCRLTGHVYVGPTTVDGRTAYDLRLAGGPSRVDATLSSTSSPPGS